MTSVRDFLARRLPAEHPYPVTGHDAWTRALDTRILRSDPNAAREGEPEGCYLALVNLRWADEGLAGRGGGRCVHR